MRLTDVTYLFIYLLEVRHAIATDTPHRPERAGAKMTNSYVAGHWYLGIPIRFWRHVHCRGWKIEILDTGR